MIKLLQTAGIALFATIMVPMGAAAQTVSVVEARQNPAERGVEPICMIEMRDGEGRVISNESRAGGGGSVIAICDGSSYFLGQADGFVMMPHRDSGAIAVVVGRENDRKIWLLSRRGDGGILVEDLTFEFARAVGQSATASLADVRVNLGRFRATGVIAAEPIITSEQGTRSATAAEVSFAERLILERQAFDTSGGVQ